MSWWIKKVLLLYVPTKIGGLLEWKPLIWKFARLYVVINGEVINGECAPSMEHSRKLDWICYIPQPASQGTHRGLLVSSLYCQHPSQIVPGYVLFIFFFFSFFPLAVRTKARRWKNCTCLVLCHWLVGLVQDSSCHVWCSQEPHLQCWAYHPGYCNEVMNSINIECCSFFLEHKKCNAMAKPVWLIQMYVEIGICYC